MKNLSKTLFFSFLAIILSFSIEASESSLLKSQIEGLNKEKVNIESSLLDQKSKLEEVIGKIRNTRDLQDKSYNVFREFELQNLLKKAQTMASKISDLNSQKTYIDRNLNDKREDLFIQFNLEINTLLKSVKKEPQNKIQTLVKLKGVLAERSLLSQYLSPKYRAQVDSISIDPDDSANEIIEKAKILEDYRSRLAKELADVEDKLDTLKRQTFALNEMSHLLDEEDFFTETGFLKSVSRKDAVSKEAASLISPAPAESTPTSGANGQNSTAAAATTNGASSAIGPETASNTQTASSASTQNQTTAVENTKSVSANGTNPANNSQAVASQASKSSIDTTLAEGAATKDTSSPAAIQNDTSAKTGGNLNVETKTTNQNTSAESLNTVGKDSEGNQVKRARGYQSGGDGKEKSINHDKDLSLENQTKLLEGERANLKRLIREIEEKYSSMRGDASRFQILKNY